MKLLSLFGLDRHLRRLRIAAGEGALAAEDRVHLLQLGLADARQRLGVILGLAIAVIGLTTVAVAVLSVAIVVHFWDTPYRITAAWIVAAVWIAIWIVAATSLINTLRSSSGALEPSRREFERDWYWVRERLGAGKEHPESPAEALTRDELLERIARQRERIATLQAEVPRPPEEPASNEPLSAVVVRVAREHPIATGAAATAAIAVLGPRRILRWAAVIGPILWRMR